MNKEEVKIRWESNENGGGITFNDIADCAKEWGISKSPRTMNMERVRYLVLRGAGTEDAESYKDNE